MTALAEPDDIRAQLLRLRTAGPIATSPQLVSFLDYVVQETLAGRGHELKGYTIAVEALGRSPNFDPQNDPIVRVEARRLRQALKAYYEGPGRDDPIIIDIPVGGYIPQFRERTSEARDNAPVTPASIPESAPNGNATNGSPQAAVLSQVAPPPPQQQPQPMVRRRLIAVLACIAAIAATLLAAALIGQERPGNAARAPVDVALEPREMRLPVVRVANFEAVGEPEAPGRLARLLAERLAVNLSRFDEIRVFSPSAPASNDEKSEYILRGRVIRRPDGGFGFGVAVLAPGSRDILLAREFISFQPDGAPPGPDSKAVSEQTALRGPAIDLAQQYGVIAADQHARLANDSGGDGACLYAAQLYWREPTRERHAQARECLLKIAERGQANSLVQAHLSFLALDEYRLDYNPLPGSALDRALVHARDAVDAGPASARAQQALMGALFTRNDIGPALKAGERALMLNPIDPDVIADDGARLVQSGADIRGGRDRLLEAAGYMQVRSPYHDFWLVVSALLLNDRSAAISHAKAIASDADSLSVLARLLAARAADDKEQAKAMAKRLASLDERFRTDPRSLVARRVVAPETLNWLIQEIQTALAEIPT
ncbi:MAG: hypothetical protein ABWZ80_04265 [Beijerinckiaceae bacterium]